MKKQKGFTLIELLVVVAIIGILAAIGVVTFGGFQGAAKRNAVTSNHNNLKNLDIFLHFYVHAVSDSSGFQFHEF